VIVVDASAVIELLLHTEIGKSVARRIADSAVSLHAPHLLDLEVAQVLRRLEAGGVVGGGRTTRALEVFGQLDIARWAHDALLPRICALRANLTAYDAAYVSLAEALPATVLTCDAKLADASLHTARVEVVT